MDDKNVIGCLANKAPVVERVYSHIHTEYKEIYQIIKSILPLINPGGDFFNYTHDFGSVIGSSICVKTDSNDDIVYAQRPGRAGLTRFVKQRNLRPTAHVTIVLKRDTQVDYEQYVVITAYVGEAAPPEPWDKNANNLSNQFWSTHALVWGSVEIIPGTETSTCPW